MLADHDRSPCPTREGRRFDIVVTVIAAGIILGALFIFNSASREYRIAGGVGSVPTILPWAIREIGPTPQR